MRVDADRNLNSFFDWGWGSIEDRHNLSKRECGVNSGLVYAAPSDGQFLVSGNNISFHFFNIFLTKYAQPKKSRNKSKVVKKTCIWSSYNLYIL